MSEHPPQRTRRELLKLSPLLVLGSFAVPSWREPLLERGVAWSDRASDAIFRRDHLAASHPDSEVAPFEQFPYNGYDVMEPEIDFANWALTVGGAVTRPGPYTLDQIRALPKQSHNTRHICVEGWDVIGRFGGARLSDFLTIAGAEPGARFLTFTCADDYSAVALHLYVDLRRHWPALRDLANPVWTLAHKPVQLSALGWFFGGYHGARLIHFLSMCGLLAFIPGHLIMVLLHGWDNLASMVTGWKRYPEYTSRDRS